MSGIAAMLTHWQLDTRQVRDQMYRAPTPRESERWHALWLLAQGWSANKVAELLERDAHTIGGWLAESTSPVLTYTAHAAGMQMRFYRGASFPREYRGDAFATMHGSWNRKPPSGYEVVHAFDIVARGRLA